MRKATQRIRNRFDHRVYGIDALLETFSTLGWKNVTRGVPRGGSCYVLGAPESSTFGFI